MITFLSEIGKVLAIGLRVIGVFEPIVQQVYPKADPIVVTVDTLFQRLSSAIVSAEKNGKLLGLSGADKARLAAADFSQIFLAIADAAGHKVANGPAVTTSMTTMAGSFADFLNAMSHETIQTAPPNPVPPPPHP